ncbi:MAG TPA: phosphate propanoyltransferase [Acholeplasmataceae bacterium]|nr:phosphate propanoyltransferase [Acholeplasmataceae bacterium]
MENKILIETSARHIHLNDEAVKVLFGKEAKLTFKKELSQPGQFQSNERVTVVGPKRQIENVAILGPTRNAVQVEISATDARSIGINSVVRLSGDIKDTPGCKLVGPCGELEISEGVIVAKRHIHLTKKDAVKFGVKDNDIVKVEVKNDSRSLVFNDVIIRIKDTFAAAMHIDTDESNAAGVNFGDYGTIIK